MQLNALGKTVIVIVSTQKGEGAISIFYMSCTNSVALFNIQRESTTSDCDGVGP
jgi:flavin reductase (DIM6/NTAB) family NADH-FMN oxidoreductase RutF